jgi:lipoprotein-anchoring transpeptidase ErfK/SrfK
LIKATTAAGAAVVALVALCALAACSSAGGATTSKPTTSGVGSAAWTTKSSPAKHLPTARRSAIRVERAARRKAHVARAPKPRNFCAHNAAAQKVIVRISKQHAWMCAHHRDVFDTAVTTGMVGQWTHTPTGHYMIQGRNTNTVLTLNTGATYDVKYWIPFDAPLFGFHDASWQKFPFGSAKYKTKGSHGCVHMPLKAMKFLYNWSVRPTAVHIY